MKFLQWLFELGDLDAYYVPRLMYETLQHELAEAKRLLVATQQEAQRLSTAKINLSDYAEREFKLLRDQANSVQLQNERLSSANKFYEETHVRLLDLLKYNNIPYTLYVRMPGAVCSSINQEAVTMLHSRFKTKKDAN